MKINNIDLAEEKATLFITLYAKALDYRSKRPLLHDRMADELIRSIDFDFSPYKAPMNLTPIRARQYDDRVNAFIREQPGGVVVYLGCGMDTRVYRIDPPESIAWFDVDYPEVIELRKVLLPGRKSYVMIASSITDKGWLEQIPRDRPTLIIAEGALEYVEPNDIKMLFERLTGHFEQGQIMFDVMNTFAADLGRKRLKEMTGAVVKWAVDTPGEVDAMNEKMKRESCVAAYRSPYIKELPFKQRLVCRTLALVPKFRDMMRVMSYRF